MGIANTPFTSGINKYVVQKHYKDWRKYSVDEIPIIVL